MNKENMRLNIFYKHLIYGLIVLFNVGTILAQNKKSILFIGNSHIFYSDKPSHFSRICASIGDTMVVGQRAPGGWGLKTHLESSATMERIRGMVWDYIVLQESRGGLLSRDFAGVISTAISLKDSIVQNSSCTRILWDMIHPSSEDPLILENSLTLADSLGFEIAPIWSACFDLPLNGWTQLLLDGNHQNVKGAYLSACVFYSTIFHRSGQGVNTYFPKELSANEAKLYQQVAWKIVSSGYGKWNIDSVDVVAGFETSIGPGLMVTCTNQTVNASSYEWIFGDGNSTTETSPMHQYMMDGSYYISLTTKMECKWDHEIQMITLGDSTTSIQDSEPQDTSVRLNHNHKTIHLSKVIGYHLIISSIDGRILVRKQILSGDAIIPIPEDTRGLIILSLRKGQDWKTFKFIL